MDATVEQRDGYRFVYSLPFGPRELMIEDTFYSDGPDLDQAALGAGLDRMAEAHGPAECIGEEAGVLPILLGGELEALWPVGSTPVARLGMRGGFFHPTTGYSLPDAVRNALLLCEQRDLRSAAAVARFPRPGRAPVGRAPLLPAAQPPAVPRRRARPALPRARTFLPAAAADHRPLLRRPADRARQAEDPQRTPAGRARPGAVRNPGQGGMSRRAAVIGSGFGGLALAIRLQSAGIATTVIEARDKPGGRAYFWEKDGHVFDAGPTVITDPDCLKQLWALTGADMAARRQAGPGLALLPPVLARRVAFRLSRRR